MISGNPKNILKSPLPAIKPKSSSYDKRGVDKKGSATTLPEKKVKKKALPVLVAIKPLNLQAEKSKFFARNFCYDPQFIYSQSTENIIESSRRQVSEKYLPQALKIIEHGIKLFGSYTSWVESSGGETMSKEDVYKYVINYLHSSGVLAEIKVNITENLLSYASMTRVKGFPTINIREGKTRKNWISGMLNHEIGTHYMRGYNNHLQPWRLRKGRKKFGLLPPNPTEEGLASLNTHIDRSTPVLLRSSLMYMTVCLALRYSFSQVYEKLTPYIDCPETRWDYVMRAKRGQTDTSLPGCFAKDQIYLAGALQILAERNRIDFDALYQCGKVSYRDVEKIKDKASVKGTRLPHFLLDKQHYLSRLDAIVTCSGLTEEDLLQ